MGSRMSRINIKFNDKFYSKIFILPAFISLIILTVYPLVFSAWYSLFDWNLVKPGSIHHFIWFDNYTEILQSQAFWKSLGITLNYTFFSVIGSMLLGTVMAFVLFSNIKGTALVRTFVIAAMVMAPVVVGNAWRLMYNSDYGLINYILSLVGIPAQPFLASANTVLPSLIITDVWQWAPLPMVIILASLQGLPESVFEAAVIDGANKIKIFFYVTLPMLKNAFLLALLMRTMDSFRTFDIIYAMTSGGPGTSSLNLNLMIYNTGFEFYQISKGSAMAFICTIIIISICSLIIKMMRKEDEAIW
jgi:multiple sugar transport system permease protein